MLGVVQNQDSYAQGVAAQRPFYFDHVAALTDRRSPSTPRSRAGATRGPPGYRLEDAEYVIVGQGSVVPNARRWPTICGTRAGSQVGVLEPHDVPAVPGRPRCRAAGGQERRRGAGADWTSRWPWIRRCCARSAPRWPGAWRTGARATDAAPYPGVPPPAAASRCPTSTRLLRAGQPRSAARRPGRGGGEHAARRLAAPAVLPRHRLHAATARGCRSCRSGRSSCSSTIRTCEDLSLPLGGRRQPAADGARSAVRIHSVGGWGAITMGKNLAMTAFELFGLQIKANPKYGSEKKGQPTTFYATLAHEPIRLNCELKHVDVVLSPDPNVFRHSDPLAGLAGGRRLRHPERPAAGRRSGALPAVARRATILGRQYPGCTCWTPSPSRRGGLRRRAALPDAGRGVHGRVLRTLAAAVSARG